MTTLPDWVGTYFSHILGYRLFKEIPGDQIQALFERDGEHPPCILCHSRVPARNGGFLNAASCYHHIEPRGMGGGTPNVLPNLAPTCDRHHQEPLQSMPDLWRHAMIAGGKAKPDDYPTLEWPDLTARLYPPVQECMGLWGFGSMVYKDGIPPLIRKVFSGLDDERIVDYCLYCCPGYKECARESRERFYRKLKTPEG